MADHVSFGQYYNLFRWNNSVDNRGNGNQAPVINAAAEFCHRKGRTLVIPPGLYNLTEPLDFDGLDGLSVMGAPGESRQNATSAASGSKGTRIRYNGNDNTTAYSMQDIAGATISGIFFDVDPSVDAPVVAVSGGAGAQETKVSFKDCRFGCINTQGGSSVAIIDLAAAVNLSIRDCYLEGANNGIVGAGQHWSTEQFPNAGLSVESTHIQNIGNNAAGTGYSIVNPPDGAIFNGMSVQARRAGIGVKGDPNFIGTIAPFVASGITVEGCWIGDTEAPSTGAAYFEMAVYGMVVSGCNLVARQGHGVFRALGVCDGVTIRGNEIPGSGPIFDFQTNAGSTAYPAGRRVGDSSRIVGMGNAKHPSGQGLVGFRGGVIPSGSIWHEHGVNSPQDRDLLVRNGATTQTLGEF